MAPTSSSIVPIQQFSDSLLRAIAAEAEADADRVALLVREMGYDPSPSKPVIMDRELLLFFGAALRLYSWEKAGIATHRDRGLPPASDLFTNAARALVEEGKKPNGSELGILVMKMFVEDFAWNGRLDLGAPVALDSLDEDTAVDALAELLWNRRTAKGECQE
jgi:hypothetical protein